MVACDRSRVTPLLRATKPPVGVIETRGRVREREGYRSTRRARQAARTPFPLPATSSHFDDPAAHDWVHNYCDGQGQRWRLFDPPGCEGERPPARGTLGSAVAPGPLEMPEGVP